MQPIHGSCAPGTPSLGCGRLFVHSLPAGRGQSLSVAFVHSKTSGFPGEPRSRHLFRKVPQALTRIPPPPSRFRDGPPGRSDPFTRKTHRDDREHALRGTCLPSRAASRPAIHRTEIVAPPIPIRARRADLVRFSPDVARAWPSLFGSLPRDPSLRAGRTGPRVGWRPKRPLNFNREDRVACVFQDKTGRFLPNTILLFSPRRPALPRPRIMPRHHSTWPLMQNTCITEKEPKRRFAADSDDFQLRL